MIFNFGLKPLGINNSNCCLYALKMLTSLRPEIGIARMELDS
jgi:hypothetical protein